MELTLAFKIIGIHFFLLKEVQPEPDKVHAFNASPVEFEASLVYNASSKTARTTETELQRPSQNTKQKPPNKHNKTRKRKEPS